MTGYAASPRPADAQIALDGPTGEADKVHSLPLGFPKSALGLAAAPTIRYPKLVDLLSARLLLGNGAGFKVEIIGVPKVILGGPQFD